MKKALFTFGMSLLIAGGAQAGTITMEDAGFQRLFTTLQNGVGNRQATHFLNVGTKPNHKGWDVHAGFVFQMTGASAAGLQTADFSVSLTDFDGTPIYNVDVYVNRVAATADFLLSDFESGTKVMDDFVTTSSTVGNYSLDSRGRAKLLTYLRANWVEGDYVFITLKSDQADMIMGEAVSANYKFGGAADEWTAGATDAQLSVTDAYRDIPEPASIGLLMGLGAGLMLVRRRRRSF
jgi:hypothetical protein